MWPLKGLTDLTVGSNSDVFHSTCIAGDSCHLLKCDQKSHMRKRNGRCVMTRKGIHEECEMGRAGVDVEQICLKESVQCDPDT